MELCNNVKALGASLLAALEKKDAEALAILRATQETGILKAIRLVKEHQLEEAKTNLDALQKTLDDSNPFATGRVDEMVKAHPEAFGRTVEQ